MRERSIQTSSINGQNELAIEIHTWSQSKTSHPVTLLFLLTGFTAHTFQHPRSVPSIRNKHIHWHIPRHDKQLCSKYMQVHKNQRTPRCNHRIPVFPWFTSALLSLCNSITPTYSVDSENINIIFYSDSWTLV